MVTSLPDVSCHVRKGAGQRRAQVSELGCTASAKRIRNGGQQIQGWCARRVMKAHPRGQVTFRSLCREAQGISGGHGLSIQESLLLVVRLAQAQGECLVRFLIQQVCRCIGVIYYYSPHLVGPLSLRRLHGRTRLNHPSVAGL